MLSQIVKEVKQRFDTLLERLTSTTDENVDTQLYRDKTKLAYEDLLAALKVLKKYL